MLQLYSVEGYNWVTYKHFYLELSDGQSIFIGGLNEDASSITSNGVGKSLIIDAVYWCNYDITVRGFGKNDVIGNHDEYTYVKNIYYDDDNRKIEIKRYRNHPKHKNNVVVKINGKESSKTKNISKVGTNKQIVKILGMDSVAFLYSIIFSKTRQSVCEAKPAERTKLISHIIGLDVIDDGLKIAKMDKKKYIDVIHKLDVKISSETSLLKESKKRIRDMKRSLEQIEERDKIEKERIKEKNRRIKINIRKLKKERNKIEETLDSLTPELELQETKKRELDKMRIKLNKVMGNLGKAISISKEKIKDYEESRKVIVDCKKQSGIECPLCKQHISPSHVRKRVYYLRQDMSKKKQKKKNALKRVKVLEIEVKTLKDNIKFIERSLKKDIEKKYYELESRWKSIRSEIITLKKSKTKHIKSFDTLDMENKIKQLKIRIKTSEKSIKQLKKMYKKTSEALNISEFWVNGFGSRGLKRFIINGILNVLEIKTNEYLDVLTDRYMSVSWDGDEEKNSRKITDKLHLNVKIGNGEKRDYHYCSEGEKARVWLATDLALNDVREISIDIMFIDECFDGLDKNGIRKAIELITGESMKRKMVCISHRDGVSKHFTNKKVVVMKNGTSTLKAA